MRRLLLVVWLGLLTLGAGLLLGLLAGPGWAAFALLPLAAAGRGAGVMLGRNWRSWRYAERADDLLISRGVLWREVTVVPYGRMQLVEVTSGPVERHLRAGQRAAPHGRRGDRRRDPGPRARPRRSGCATGSPSWARPDRRGCERGAGRGASRRTRRGRGEYGRPRRRATRTTPSRRAHVRCCRAVRDGSRCIPSRRCGARGRRSPADRRFGRARPRPGARGAGSPSSTTGRCCSRLRGARSRRPPSTASSPGGSPTSR